MTRSQLKRLSINAVEVGMFIHSIAEQKGNFQVKTQGRVTSTAIITALKKKGIKTVIIDLSKQLPTEPPPDNTTKQPINCDQPEPEPVDGSPQECESKEVEKPIETVAFAEEIEKASELHQQGKQIQQTLLQTVQNGLPFDEQIPRQFTTELVGSIDRNPDALNCLTKIREKDDYLFEHSLNVAILLANFGKYIGLPKSEVEDLAYAGFLHDIGKIRIPDEILHKPGRLTDDEMDVMRKHVAYGLETLDQAGIDPRLVHIVSLHHERLDGKGYPKGVAGKDINREGRMIAIVDVYDALTADRVYKPGMSSQQALQILLKDCPNKYDHNLLQRFIKCMGIYPVGSLVKLTDDHLAIVTELNKAHPVRPRVKVFYCTRSKRLIESRELDLASQSTTKIEKAILASQYELDMKTIFQRDVLNPVMLA